MKRANVSGLRAHLRRYLDAVKHGETIEIVERDLPVARLTPVPVGLAKKSADQPAWVERLRRKGGARIGTLRGGVLRGLRLPEGTMKTGAVRALLDEREDGR
jgi:prevent-host-death family protein